MHRLIGWLLALSAIFTSTATLYANSAIAVHASPLPQHVLENYQPSLGDVQTLDQAVRIIPAFMDPKEKSREKRTADAINRFLRARFFHGYSELRVNQDWVAALAGMLWQDLRNPVLADDILKFRRAACSQQAIVFQALLKRFGIHYGSVTFDPGHFAVAAKVDGQWLYYDSDGEPLRGGLPVADILKGKYLTQIYPNAFGVHLRDVALRGNARLQHIDTYPAPHGALFERATLMFSAFGWLLLWLAFFAWQKVGLRRPALPARRRLQVAY